jgi:tetratricopeptide (TPR) repeat protein
MGRWATGVLLVLAVALGARAGIASDSELAKLLIKQGRAALDKGQATDAVTKLRRATTEDADQVDGWYWLGQALEKQRDSAEAIAAYRSCQEAITRLRAKSSATADDSAIAAKASARLDALAAGESEFRRLEEKYVGGLLVVAKENSVKDEATAKRAVALALAVAPSEPQALALAKFLRMEAAAPGEKPAAGASADPAKPAAFSKWVDLIATKGFDSVEDLGGSIAHESLDGGEINWAEPNPEITDSFCVEFEYRVLSVPPGKRVHAGFAFSRSGRRFLAVLGRPTEVLLAKTDDDAHEDIASTTVPALKQGDWRKITLTCSAQRRLTIAADGKRLFEHDLPSDFEPTGRMGIWTQNGKVEYRVVRVGTP